MVLLKELRLERWGSFAVSGAVERGKYYNGIDNSCTIYDDRPQICRVDEMFYVKYNKYFSIEEFYLENAKVCNSLQEKYKLNKIFRIEIKK